MSDIELPIVIAEEWDVSMHPSVEAAAAFLEPWNAERAEVFDATGKLLRATTDGRTVHLELAESALQRPNRLLYLLRGFCDRAGIPTPHGSDLPHLIQACIDAGRLLGGRP